MKHILFFALKEDILPVLDLVERDRTLKYIRMGQFPKSDYETFVRGAEIPNLGKATADSAVRCESFLVAERTLPIKARPIKLVTGDMQFAIDQLENPDTVTFTPGGAWGTDIVLHGRVATASDSDSSQELMREFHRACKNNFIKVKAFLVGPRAFSLLKAGKRLTIAAQSPRDVDLTTTT